MDGMAVQSAARGQDIGWQSRANDLNQNRLRDAGGKLSSAADYEAQSAAWEAKNEFAAHASAMGGIAGMNAGSLAPGDKPQQMDQLAVSGMLDGWGVQGGKAVQNANNNASGAAWYSVDEGGLKQSISNMSANGQRDFGSAGINSSWAEGGGHYTMTGSIVQSAKQGSTGSNYISESESAAVKQGAGNAIKEAGSLATKGVESVQEWADNWDGKPGK
jgi:hypothetical protein